MAHTDIVGTIYPIYRACCGICDQDVNLGVCQRGEAVQTIKAMGWKFDGDNGYICTICVAATARPSAGK